ncbi:ImmA/IrrE family metallo-endopeptidase [Elizabethkingia anophelis]|uniref:IrrE N-terminal-like domain-containing protein n=1 Tax=Elizabethkingia anophelis TaxID=1117645 RepID=A0AAU8UYX1_9FLAO|nr:ImmA/IrrE family metallo-endopeptidase [Elizabethkingia anophelis]AQX01474.1 hypothetical protein BBD32_08370 [Elizabethkingia anophelis]OPB62035.1 hypothetical protein BAY11_17020 [Elizabethkingia anophelis]
MAPITLKRGFKAEAERISVRLREAMGIHPCARLCAFKLAEHLNLRVFKATDFLSDEKSISLLEGTNGYSNEWSALTMINKDDERIIIYNPFNSEARQQSDLMHEIAHILCKHELSNETFGFKIPFGMREYNPIQEEEAKCLGASLQLSKPSLLWSRKRKLTNEQISQEFNASIEMVRYRMAMTGIYKR